MIQVTLINKAIRMLTARPKRTKELDRINEELKQLSKSKQWQQALIKLNEQYGNDSHGGRV